MNPFDAIPTEISNRTNHFTVYDAREFMWRALTLTTREGLPADPDFLKGEDRRKVYWASMFRTLGQVVHLLQDAAQPQHTRDEGHGPGSRAGYEEYLDARVEGKKRYRAYFVSMTSSEAQQLPPLNLEGYAIPRFSRYSDFWRSGPDTRRVGLADYSNRGFYTPGNNVGNNVKYQKPQVDPVGARTRGDEEILPGWPFYYVYGTVEDSLTTSTDSTSLSSEALFPRRDSSGMTRTYHITPRNYEDRAALLLPRAVAYSAGLIDYFFRGKLQIGVPNQGVYGVVDHKVQFAKDTGGFSKLLVKVANLTGPITPSIGGPTQPQEMTGGKLIAVVKFHRNNCYTPNLYNEYNSPENVKNIVNCRSFEEEIVVSSTQTVDTIPSMTSGGVFDQIGKDYTFSFPSVIPINATDIYLQVVYRGPLGQEADAVVVTTKDIPEPTYYSMMNLADYVFCYNDHYYFREAGGAYSSSSLPYPPSDASHPALPLPVDEPLSIKPGSTALVYRLSFGSNSPVSAPLVTMSVAKKEHGRVAVLGDYGRPMSRGIDGFGGITQVFPSYATNQGQVGFVPETLRNVRSHFPMYPLLRGGTGDCGWIASAPPGHLHPFGTEPGFITDVANLPALVQSTIFPPFNAP